MSSRSSRSSRSGATSDAPSPGCDSCGVEGEQLYAVHRQYVTPAAWDTPARELTLDEVEHWCFPCCTHYPHQPAG